MRVVRLITRLNRGGPLRQLEALVPGLAREGCHGPVWTGEPADGEQDASGDLARHGVGIERVPGLTRGIDLTRDARAWRWIRRRLVALRPDVVHTHLGKAGALGRSAARAAGVPVIVHTLHGHHLDAPGPLALATRPAERGLGTLTDAVIVLSEGQRRDLVDRHRVLDPSRVAVIGPGFDVARLVERGRQRSDDVEALRRRLSPDGRPTFLWMGRFVPMKAPLALIEAARFASQDAFRLVLAGEGPLLSRCRARALACGLADRVRFVGEVEDPALHVLATDGVVLSSVSEGTPMALLEAMALGRPVVSFAVGGVPDVVAPETTGLLVPPGNTVALGYAMARLASDEGLRARLGAEGARRAPLEFGPERLVTATVALYRRLREVQRAAPARVA